MASLILSMRSADRKEAMTLKMRTNVMGKLKERFSIIFIFLDGGRLLDAGGFSMKVDFGSGLPRGKLNFFLCISSEIDRLWSVGLDRTEALVANLVDRMHRVRATLRSR